MKPGAVHLGLEVVDGVWARNAQNALDPDVALALAYAELNAFRGVHESRST
jgi:hypothetical protein